MVVFEMFDNIVSITKDYMKKNLDLLIELDKPEVEAGNLEHWSTDNYIIKIESKFSLSVGIEHDGELVGYRIMTGGGKLTDFAHGHRINVHRQWRRMNVAKRLLDVTHERAKRVGYIGVTNFIHNSNRVSLKFFQTYGYTKIRTEHDKTLLAYILYHSVIGDL